MVPHIPVSETPDSIWEPSTSMCYLVGGGGGVEGIIYKKSPKIWYSPKRLPKNFVPSNKSKEIFRTPPPLPLSKKSHKRKQILYNTMNYGRVQPSKAFMLTLGQSWLIQKFNYSKRFHLSSSINDELNQKFVVLLIVIHVSLIIAIKETNY